MESSEAFQQSQEEGEGGAGGRRLYVQRIAIYSHVPRK